MAMSGLSVIDAINEIVETVGEFPLASNTNPVPDGTGTSIYHRARQFLDREDKRLQSLGWPENTIMSKKFTANGSNGTIGSGEGLTTTVLRVRAAGPDAHRTIVMREAGGTQLLHDSNADTNNFGNSAEVYLDTVYLLDFIDLPSLLQDVIVAKAKMEFQRRIQGNPQLDQALYQEYIQAEVALDRIRPDTVQPFNVQPMIPGGGGGGGAEKKGG